MYTPSFSFNCHFLQEFGLENLKNLYIDHTLISHATQAIGILKGRNLGSLFSNLTLSSFLKQTQNMDFHFQAI